VSSQSGSLEPRQIAHRLKFFKVVEQEYGHTRLQVLKLLGLVHVSSDAALWVTSDPRVTPRTLLVSMPN
jgi:hypothetical protein